MGDRSCRGGTGPSEDAVWVPPYQGGRPRGSRRLGGQGGQREPEEQGEQGAASPGKTIEGRRQEKQVGQCCTTSWHCYCISTLDVLPFTPWLIGDWDCLDGVIICAYLHRTNFSPC